MEIAPGNAIICWDKIITPQWDSSYVLNHRLLILTAFILDLPYVLKYELSSWKPCPFDYIDMCFTSVYYHMFFQLDYHPEGLVTLTALLWFHPCMCFLMPYEGILFVRIHFHNVCIGIVYLQFVSLDDLLNI